MTLEILGLGGAEEVGRSSFLLTENDHSLLLDAGLKLFPKRLNIPPLEPAVPLEKRDEFYSSLDAILVSHAHLDHVGYIPAAYHYGYRGKVYMTKPTADLADLVWKDGLKIQGDRFYNRKDVELTKKNIVRLNYNQKIRLTDTTSAKFYDAGHILGSAAIELDWDGQKILYTGDITDQQSLLHTGHKIPITNEKYSFIITETTNHHHSKHIQRKKSSRNLIQSALENYKHKGKMIIPAFAVGRSQEILSILMTYLDDFLYSYPIYMAGAINKVNKIYDKYFTPNWINKEIISRVKDQDKSLKTPWDHPELKETVGMRKQKSIMKDPNPKIIVATHGMIETGPVHGFLAQGAHKKSNLLAFVGYQAPGSIGADIQAGTKEVELGYGKRRKKYRLGLNQEKFSFSGHISRENLQKFLTTMSSKHYFTVHGELESMNHLNNSLISDGLKGRILPSMESIKV